MTGQGRADWQETSIPAGIKPGTFGSSGDELPIGQGRADLQETSFHGIFKCGNFFFPNIKLVNTDGMGQLILYLAN